MKNKIIFYELNGNVSSEELLCEETLRKTNGMMVKCIMSDGREKVGFSDPLRTGDGIDAFDDLVHDHINLWTWDNLDENKHELVGDNSSKFNQTFEKVIIKDIVYIEAILHSNPRYGGKLTNSFDYFISRFTK